MSNPSTLSARELTELFIRQTSHLQKALLIPMILKSMDSCDFDHLRIQLSRILTDESPLASEHLYEGVSLLERWCSESQAHVARTQKSTIDFLAKPGEPT